MASTDQHTREAPGRLGDERAAPESPTDLSARSWRGVLSRTFREFKDDNLTVWAAALTYYGILAIFPAIIALVSILGLIGPSATQPLLDNVSQVAPGPAKDILTSTIQNLQNNRGSAGVMFFVGIALALWSASGYVASFMQAANAIYDIPEGRPIWKTVPVRLGVTVVLVALLAVSAVAVVLTGTLAKQAGDVVGVGSTAVTVWDIAKWPVLLLIVSLMFAILYYFSPNVKQPGFRWVSPGGIVAVAPVDPRLGRLRVLRGQLRLVQQDLRRAGRTGDLPGLAVDLEHRHPPGCRGERRARARAAHRGRAPGRRRAVRRAARHAQVLR